MRAFLLLLLGVTGQSVALWDCPYPLDDLPSYQQVAQEVLMSLNTSFPKDLLSFGNAHTESIERLHCANASPAVRAGATQYAATAVFHPNLWPNRTVHYSIRRSEYTPAAVTRLEAEIKWVNDNTCVTFEETCSAGEKCVFITPPSEETLKTYTPVGYPPDDYEDIYYVSRTIELVENYGILDWIMWILGFMQDHNRYDREKYLTISQLHDNVDSNWMKGSFLKNVKTTAHMVFPYDPQSATHMTVTMASKYGVSLTTLDPVKHVIKETPDGVLSPIDIQKVHYYYCNDTPTYPVSSLPPELQSPDDTTSDSTEPPQTTMNPATTSLAPYTTATTIKTTTPTTITTTTTTTTTTIPDPRFTLSMKFDGLGGELPDESFNTTTSTKSTTTTPERTTTIPTAITTTAFPMTSSGARPLDPIIPRMLESSLLLVTMVTYWLC